MPFDAALHEYGARDVNENAEALSNCDRIRVAIHAMTCWRLSRGRGCRCGEHQLTVCSW